MSLFIQSVVEISKPTSDFPLYRQLSDQIRRAIVNGSLPHGARLPPTRELAGQLGLNRTTISAAYTLLESEGFIEGHVGRGSFVKYNAPALPDFISFASSRPSEKHFPMADFRATVEEVIGAPAAAQILQLGSPTGYEPLRAYLLEDARRSGEAGHDDDILITNGCQQALDLLQRTLQPGEAVVTEDPVYHGLKNIFARGGSRLIGVRVGPDGIEADQLERALSQERPKLLVVTPTFQNPTGATVRLPAREALVGLARDFAVTLVENDIYGELRYEGEALPTLKQLDRSGNTVLLRSFSKVAFPGLRVGWVIAPAPMIARLAEAKQWSDLHTDQLSQAILLRFAQSGRLESHKIEVRAMGAERLKSAVSACERHLPPGSVFTRPEGGMSLWIELPAPLDAAELLPRAQRENVSYLPGKYFFVSRSGPGAFRLSFGGLPPAQIERGVATLGGIFTEELERSRTVRRIEAAHAVV